MSSSKEIAKSIRAEARNLLALAYQIDPRGPKPKTEFRPRPGKAKS